MSSIELDPIIELSCLEITSENKAAFKKQLVSENAPNFRDGCFVVPKILN